MIASEAAQVLETLALGIDPETGKPFSDVSVFQNPDIVRALFLGANVLKQQASVGPRRAERTHSRDGKGRRAETGKPWMGEEEQRLVEGLESELSIADLAFAHERNIGDIRSQLVKLGLMEEAPEIADDDLRWAD